MTQTFRYAIDWKLAPFWVPFAMRPWADGVTVTDDDRLVATFGYVRLETPLANVSGAHITRDYRWWTAVGARRSFVDDGLTFGTNTNGGVCVHFAAKVPSLLNHGGHSALTVTVADLDGLVAALAR